MESPSNTWGPLLHLQEIKEIEEETCLVSILTGLTTNVHLFWLEALDALPCSVPLLDTVTTAPKACVLILPCSVRAEIKIRPRWEELIC